MSMNNIKQLGQVFTPDFIVMEMISLIKNSGTILEPSAGNGAFVKRLINKNLTSIELDPKLAKKSNSLCMDFFDYPIDNKFDTIIGNPPYVRHQDILNETKQKLDYSIFDNRSNLCLFFIYKAIKHLNKNGELIFITPRDFLKATSAIKLNKFIYNSGTITDIIDLGDKRIFNDATPNTIIWRFEKDNFSRTTNIKKEFVFNRGQLLFTNNRYSINFSDLFFIKVGAVSGSDKIFTSEKYGNVDFVCSYTRKTGKTKKMIYDIKHPYLEQFKEQLIKRKIRKFNECNWWEWGRKYYESDKKRIYVNQKTRNKKPFFISDIKAYDGSVLAIFPKKEYDDDKLNEICEELNNVDWGELGFIVDGRYIFGQKSLSNSLLPDTFKKFL